MTSLFAQVVAMDRPTVRLGTALALIGLTLVSPFITLPAPLPALRLEQVVLALAALPMLRLMLVDPDMRRVTLVDAAFLALAITTTITIVLAPFVVPGATRSFRDGFEIVRIVEYWLLFRIGLSLVPAGLAGQKFAWLLAAASIGLGGLAILQYLNPPGFNDTVTAFWTQAHNLAGVEREGRAVGTAGNANQFGVLAVLLLFVGLAGRLSAEAGKRNWPWVVATGAATVALVLTQSRGAILGGLAGLLAAMMLLAVRRTLRRGLLVSIPPVLMALAAAAALVVFAPPATGSIAQRFDITGLLQDRSVVIRLGRIASLFADTATPAPAGGTNRAACVAGLTQSSAPSPGHEPGIAAPPTAPTSGAMAIAVAAAGYHCDVGAWPSDLGRDLVPAYLPTLPASSGAFSFYSSPRGYAVGTIGSVDARDEEAGIGSLPNLLANPSFETGGEPPAQWLETGGSVATTTPQGAAFGTNAADVVLPAGGALYQLVVSDLPMSTDYTFGLWVRGIDPEATTVQLYVVAILADGTRLDPLASRTAELQASSAWQHLALVIHTPAAHLTSLQVMFRAPAGPIHAAVDGASLTEGPFALPFESLVDQPPDAGAGGSGASFAGSPIIGSGPQKDDALAAYDNEYVSVLAHYGLLGLAAYLMLFLAGFLVGLRAAFRGGRADTYLGVALASFTVALAVFAVSAGAYRQLQVMVIYWMIVGVVAASTSPKSARLLSGPAGPS